MVPYPMFPADRKPTPTAVEYDSPTGRTVRHFPDAYSARRFYVAQDRQGKAPKVLRSETMATKKTPVVKSAKKVAAKKATKKATTKKAPAAKVPAETAKKSDDVMAKLWENEKRTKIFKALKSLKATDAIRSRTADVIAERAGVDILDVKFYCYKTEKLAKLGLVDSARLEGSRVLNYFITKKGASI